MGLIRKWKPGGENQIRAVSLSRSGTDLVVRWGLAAENGKKTRIYFKRSDNGAVTLLTQVALNAGVRNFTLAAQGLSSPCGDFHLGQVGSDDVESPLTPALFFAGIDFGIGHEGGCIDDPPPTPEPPKWADYYHVRDHLGTLRLVTDISGYVQEAHDYEPFGLELVPPGESPGTLSTRKFTGHERDASTGLDYMMARYYPASLAGFMSPDPLGGRIVNPQTLNKFSYVRNNPVILTDPTGMYMCRDSGDCTSDQDKNFESARQHALQSNNSDVVRAARAYGDPNKDNGVTVGFADLSGEGKDGKTISHLGTDANGNLQAQSTVTINSQAAGTVFEAVVGHEGSHVADAQDIVGSIQVPDKAKGTFKVGMNITEYSSEQRAFKVTDAILKTANQSANFACGKTNCTLGKGILPYLVNKNIDRILEQTYTSTINGQPLTPQNQGGSIVPEVDNAP